jgi:hypothetical protein
LGGDIPLQEIAHETLRISRTTKHRIVQPPDTEVTIFCQSHAVHSNPPPRGQVNIDRPNPREERERVVGGKEKKALGGDKDETTKDERSEVKSQFSKQV